MGPLAITRGRMGTVAIVYNRKGDPCDCSGKVSVETLQRMEENLTLIHHWLSQTHYPRSIPPTAPWVENLR